MAICQGFLPFCHLTIHSLCALLQHPRVSLSAFCSHILSSWRTRKRTDSWSNTRRRGSILSETYRDEVGLIAEKFQELFSLPASSAAVERAFSVQGCFLQPRRSNMSLKTVKNLMMIRMNCLLASKNGWEENLLAFLQSSVEKKRKKWVIVDYSCLFTTHKSGLYMATRMSNGKICLAKWAKDGMAGKGLVLPEIDNSAVNDSNRKLCKKERPSFL